MSFNFKHSSKDRCKIEMMNNIRSRLKTDQILQVYLSMIGKSLISLRQSLRWIQDILTVLPHCAAFRERNICIQLVNTGMNEIHPFPPDETSEQGRNASWIAQQ